MSRRTPPSHRPHPVRKAAPPAVALARVPLPANEPARLEALRRYGILDTDREADFDDLALLASQICGTPMALITLVDANRQWFKSRVGVGVSEVPRDVAFCAYAILDPDELMVVPDALEDIRFANNPAVREDPKIRFYAGAPLVTPDGFALGTLCVLDRVPRQLSPEQIAALRVLSRHVVTQLELRRVLAELSLVLSQREQAEKAMKQSESYFRSLIEHSLDIITIVDRSGLIRYESPSVEQVLGYRPAELVGTNAFDLIHPDDLPAVQEAFARGLTEPGSPQSVEFRNRHKDGSWRTLAAVGRMITGEHGELVAIVNSRDVSGREMAEPRARPPRNEIQTAGH